MSADTVKHRWCPGIEDIGSAASAGKVALSIVSPSTPMASAMFA
jgi:hypothetical protein